MGKSIISASANTNIPPKSFLCFVCSIWLLSAAPAVAQSVGIPNTTFRVEQSFVVEKLSEERLLGFEFRAKQQLADFANYIALISNPDYDKEMRRHALRLALALFDNPATNSLSGVACKDKCSVKSFLENLLSSTQTTRWQISEVKQSQALTFVSNKYTGRLSFKQQQQTAEVALILKKVEKRFGDQREWVWEVRLGDMSHRP